MSEPATTPEDLHPLPEGSRLKAPYVVESLLGEEGGWVHYRVRNERLDNHCAARVYTARWCAKPEVRKALRSCIVAQSRVSHPNVASIRDIFESEEGQELIVITDFAEGMTLRSQLELDGPLDEELAVPLVRQLLSGLRAAHRRGLIHQGLCPESIWLAHDPDGPPRVILGGFGVGRHLPGPHTEPYWAPEQLEGSEPNERTDIYAVGLLLHEMLTGERPSSNRALRDLVPTLSLRVERALLRALSEDPEERFVSVDEMRTALLADSLLAPTSITRAESTPPLRSSRASRIGYGAVAVAALIAGLISWRVSTGDDGEVLIPVVDLITTPPVDVSAHQLPAITPETPLPLRALPALGTNEALVEAVVVTHLDTLYAAPSAFSYLEALQLRYGDNLRISFLLAPLPADDLRARLRARAALAAQQQDSFLTFSDALWRTPAADTPEELVELARSAGLDPERFARTLEEQHIERLLEHHAQLGEQLGGAHPGDVFINGQRVPVPPHTVLDAPRLTRAIDVELNAAQALLTRGQALERIASSRIEAALTSRPRGLREDDGTSPYLASRYRVNLEGLPSLGAANAPLTLVLYADLALPSGVRLLERARAFYREHPERVRLLVKLSPSPGHQRGFDHGVQLLRAHAEGRFWEALKQPIPNLALPAATELLRSRLLEQSREAQALSSTHEPFLLVNGHRVIGDDALEAVLGQHLALVELVLAGGLSAEEVYLLAVARAESVTVPPREQREMLIANWRALPRLGSERAPVKIFWLFSLYDPSWPDTLDVLQRLRAVFGRRVTVCLVPAPFHARDRATLELLEHLWTQSQQELEDSLFQLRTLAETYPPTLPGSASKHALLDRFLERPVFEEPGAEAPFEDPDAYASISSHAEFWMRERIPPGSVVITRSVDDTRFSVVRLPGGLAFEPYWDAVR